MSLKKEITNARKRLIAIQRKMCKLRDEARDVLSDLAEAESYAAEHASEIEGVIDELSRINDRISEIV